MSSTTLFLFCTLPITPIPNFSLIYKYLEVAQDVSVLNPLTDVTLSESLHSTATTKGHKNLKCKCNKNVETSRQMFKDLSLVCFSNYNFSQPPHFFGDHPNSHKQPLYNKCCITRTAT